MSDTTLPYDGPAWQLIRTDEDRPLWYWTTPALLVAVYREETGTLQILRVPRKPLKEALHA